MDAGRASLLLQLFQHFGILVGLAVRCNAPIYLKLPECFFEAWYVGHDEPEAVNIVEKDGGSGDDPMLMALALAMHTGLVSILPTPMLDMMGLREMRLLFAGYLFATACAPPVYASSLSPSLEMATKGMTAVDKSEVEAEQQQENLVSEWLHISPLQLRRFADHEGGLTPQDCHLQLFWLVCYEFSSAQFHQLLRVLFPLQTRNRVGRDHLPSSLRVRFMRPTAMAMLQADAADIVAFPMTDDGVMSVSVPRVTKATVMSQKLLSFIKSEGNHGTGGSA